MSKAVVWPTNEIGTTRGVIRHGDDDWRSAGLVVQDASGTILYANAAAGRILGLSVDQMRGLTAPDPRWRATCVEGTGLPRHEHPALAALRTSAAQRRVVWGVILPDGTRRWIQVDAIPLCAEPGGVVRVISDVTDVTVQRQADERLRRVYHALAGGVLVLDPQGRVVEANAAAEELLGVPLAAMRGQVVSSCL